ncbi:MAG TPA: hypothetical protein VJ020_10710 [Anaerolineales bacterium]|nr:hypothetical protein [Anaerolineales bacterium]
MRDDSAQVAAAGIPARQGYFDFCFGRETSDDEVAVRPRAFESEGIQFAGVLDPADAPLREVQCHAPVCAKVQLDAVMARRVRNPLLIPVLPVDPVLYHLRLLVWPNCPVVQVVCDYPALRRPGLLLIWELALVRAGDGPDRSSRIGPLKAAGKKKNTQCSAVGELNRRRVAALQPELKRTGEQPN